MAVSEYTESISRYRDGTLPRLAMPETLKHLALDPVLAYRTYYVVAKSRLFSYTKRPMPNFIREVTYMTAGGKSIPAR